MFCLHMPLPFSAVLPFFYPCPCVGVQAVALDPCKYECMQWPGLRLSPLGLQPQIPAPKH